MKEFKKDKLTVKVMTTRTWDISEKCPATILRRSDNAILYLEPASAAKL